MSISGIIFVSVFFFMFLGLLALDAIKPSGSLQTGIRPSVARGKVIALLIALAVGAIGVAIMTANSENTSLDCEDWTYIVNPDGTVVHADRVDPSLPVCE